MRHPLSLKPSLDGALSPTPVSLEGPLRSEQDVLTHRRLYCVSYDRCLDHSVQQGWDGFTCTHCPLQKDAMKGPGSTAYAHARRADKT